MVEINYSQNLNQIDWTDSNNLFTFGVTTVRIAEHYQQARKTFAANLKCLKLALARAYQSREIERKLAEDKAYLVLAEWNDEYRDALKNMIDAENEYKGLEKVLETRQAVMSLAQSLIKNRADHV